VGHGLVLATIISAITTTTSLLMTPTITTTTVSHQRRWRAATISTHRMMRAYRRRYHLSVKSRNTRNFPSPPLKRISQGRRRWGWKTLGFAQKCASSQLRSRSPLEEAAMAHSPQWTRKHVYSPRWVFLWKEKEVDTEQVSGHLKQIKGESR
jgi:hypothetical protein